LNGLKNLREVAGLKQSQLAELVNVDQSAVSQWESGTVSPTADNLKKLATVLNCSADELLGIKTTFRGEKG
jgi:transcriptional regulator with XRE-family HTH domain